MPVFRAENLKKSFNQRFVVNGVNIQVESGEIVGLLGRNGAGKTTTFLMMVGLLKPNTGMIFLDDKNISEHSTHQRTQEGITYLPQENSVFLKTSVENNVKMILELQGYEKSSETAERLLDEMGLLSLAKQQAHSLSGGERRKLEICRSLTLDLKFLLLDEPFTGIDPLTIIDLQKIMSQLKRKGVGIILSDHNVVDTLKITDRAYLIDDGNILVEGNPREIAADEKARERFLGNDFKLGD
jgi:lipopolysaccharide export system ATP-binding protein